MKTSRSYSDTGTEFDRLKIIREVALNAELVAFVEKAHSSLQSRGRFKKRDCHKRSLLHYAAMADTLSWAAEYGSLAVAKILLAQGANINALDYESGTPLTWLLHAANPRITSLAATGAYLREMGAKEVKLRGIKWAWIWVLTYTCLLRYVRPRI